ncbi:fatty acid--CoA ligase family protein [Alphaproteobacteria bacterium]|nr:fatty acid--CoA ligase family protein [Alphaproteobacteria bacterium]
MGLISSLDNIWKDSNDPFFIYKEKNIFFSEIKNLYSVNLETIKKGDVVAIIGDFNPHSILTLLLLIDKGAIVVPLTIETKSEHEYFFETALVDFVIYNKNITPRKHNDKNPLISSIRNKGHSGLILFSTGTTGRPKAILHDLTLFLRRYETKRPTLRTINFLLFDHIGGINTLFHTLFNKGIVIAPEERSVQSILYVCKKYQVEVLPTTPTFLRLMLMSGVINDGISDSLKIITYGTERMDQPTLDELCRILPNIDFRQTYGMSELGIVRVKSEHRQSLYMKLGGEGVETRVVNNILEIRSPTRMLGYLNFPSPFDDDGWYNTKDIVDVKNSFYKITGRSNEIINVAGIKFMPSEVERVALKYKKISMVKACGKKNPITGEHVELFVQPKNNTVIEKKELMSYLKNNLTSYMVPKRIIIENINVGHRFKKT